MDPKHNSILTEDGQRLTIENGEIVGTEETGGGLGYETGNTLLNEEVNKENEEKPQREPEKEKDDRNR